MAEEGRTSKFQDICTWRSMVLLETGQDPYPYAPWSMPCDDEANGAALLLAFSPFHVWQSQVLRNYGLLVSLNLLAVYGAWRTALLFHVPH